MPDFDEAVALEMQDMTKRDALSFAISYLATAQWVEENVEAEAARRLLIVMRNELQGGNRANIIETNLSTV